MKYRYTHLKNGKYGLPLPNIDNHSSSSKTYVANYDPIRDEITLDQIKAKAALVPLRLTLG